MSEHHGDEATQSPKLTSRGLLLCVRNLKHHGTFGSTVVVWFISVENLVCVTDVIQKKQKQQQIAAFVATLHWPQRVGLCFRGLIHWASVAHVVRFCSAMCFQETSCIHNNVLYKFVSNVSRSGVRPEYLPSAIKVCWFDAKASEF